MKRLSFKQKVSILKGKCELTERTGYGFFGFTLNSKRNLICYGKTLSECVEFADSRKWFKKYEKADEKAV